MLVKYSFLLLLLLQLSLSTRLSNSSSQRDTGLVDQRVKSNLTADHNEEEYLIHGQTEGMNKIQDADRIVGIDSSNLTGKIAGFPKIVYYMRHFQGKHNVDPRYVQVLDPDLTEYGFQQGSKIKFDDELDLIICSPLTRTIQTYFSLFHDTERRERIPFMLDADLQETGSVPADTPRSKTDLKQKFPQLSSTIDRDLDENFNDKKNPLYSASPSRVKERVTRFHQRLLRQRTEKRIMVISHGGWLSIELNGKAFGNGQIVKQVYETEDDIASNSENQRHMKNINICLFLLAHLILLY